MAVGGPAEGRLDPRAGSGARAGAGPGSPPSSLRTVPGGRIDRWRIGAQGTSPRVMRACGAADGHALAQRGGEVPWTSHLAGSSASCASHASRYSSTVAASTCPSARAGSMSCGSQVARAASTSLPQRRRFPPPRFFTVCCSEDESHASNTAASMVHAACFARITGAHTGWNHSLANSPLLTDRPVVFYSTGKSALPHHLVRSPRPAPALARQVRCSR